MEVLDCELIMLPKETVVYVIHQGRKVTGEVHSILKFLEYEIEFQENSAEKIIVKRSQIKTKGDTFNIGDEIEVYQTKHLVKVSNILDHSMYLIEMLVSGDFEWYQRSEIVLRGRSIANEPLFLDEVDDVDDNGDVAECKQKKSEGTHKTEETSNCDPLLRKDTVVYVIHQGRRVTGEVHSVLKFLKYEIEFENNPAEKTVVTRSEIKTNGDKFNIGDQIEVFHSKYLAKVSGILDHSMYLIEMLVSGEFDWYQRSEIVVVKEPPLLENRNDEDYDGDNDDDNDDSDDDNDNDSACKQNKSKTTVRSGVLILQGNRKETF